jgi:hypothetical protein
MAKAVEDEEKVLLFEGIEGARTPVQIDQFLTDLSRQNGVAPIRWTHSVATTQPAHYPTD